MRKTSILITAICILSFLSVDSNCQLVVSTPSKDHRTDISRSLKKFKLRAFGMYEMGTTHAMPFWPEDEDSTSNGSFGVGGSGLGLSMDYQPFVHLSFFSDLILHHWRYKIGKADLRSTSDWIWEESNNTTRYTDAWTQDLFFRIRTVELRFGARYVSPLSDKTDGFLGAGVGITSWKVMLDASDRLGLYGKDQGTGFSLFAQGGFNFYLHPAKGNKTGIVLSPFVEAGLSPAKPVTLKNLLFNNWTYQNEKGEFSVLPFRLGVTVTLF